MKKKKEELDLSFDELDDDQNVNPLVTIGVFLGLLAAAVVICAILWTATHRDKQDEAAVNGETIQSETMDTLESDSAETSAEAETEESAEESAPGETVGNDASDDAEDDAVQGAAEQGAAENSGDEEKDVVLTAEDDNTPQSNVQTPADQEQDPISGNETMEFTAVSDTVTAKDVTNLRSLPSTLDAENVISQLKNGETIARTGVNDTTGWSRLDYNGQTVYAVTRFLTTDLTYKTPVAASNPNRITTQDGRVIIFADCSDYITPKEYVNLRVEPSTSQGDSTVSCQVSNGTAVHRTGYSADSGWSRVEYNGQVLYVVSSLVYVTEAQE